MKTNLPLGLIASFAFIATPALADSTLPLDMLFYETFDNVDGDFAGSDPRLYGVPTSLLSSSDEDWYGVRIQQPDNGSVVNDIGVQGYGGGGNATQTGFAEDNAGMMFRIDASLYQNIVLSFDWRTFSAGADDRLVVGYFIGDPAAGHPVGFEDRVIDLRTVAGGGPGDGAWNWTSGWTELARLGPNNTFNSVSFDLVAAAGAPDVWIAFWMDGGEGDYAKFDNVQVMGSPIPVPAAVWLFGSALLGMLGLRRRR